MPTGSGTFSPSISRSNRTLIVRSSSTISRLPLRKELNRGNSASVRARLPEAGQSEGWADGPVPRPHFPFAASGDRLLVLLCLRRLDFGLIGMPALLRFPRLVVAELGVVREIALLRPFVVARDVPVGGRRHHTPVAARRHHTLRPRSQQRQRDDAADAEGDVDDALSRRGHRL